MQHHSMPGHCAPACHRRPIVCPVQECVVDNYFVENQDYIHPTHILVQNHHLLNNYHYSPYMVSEANSFQTQEYAFPQGTSPDYNWMDYMQGGQPGFGQGQMQGMQGQMPMMSLGQMPGMEGQMPMMSQGQMPGMQGQMPGMQGQMPMMPQGQMPMGMPMGPEEGLME